MQSPLQSLLLQLLVLVDDVAVGYYHIRTHLLQLGWRDEWNMGIDHGHQARGFDVAVRCVKPAYSSGQILVQYLEAVRHARFPINKE